MGNGSFKETLSKMTLDYITPLNLVATALDLT